MVNLNTCFLVGAVVGSCGGTAVGSAAVGPLLIAQGLLWIGVHAGFHPTAEESERVTKNTGKSMQATVLLVPLACAAIGAILGGATGATAWGAGKTVAWIGAHLSIKWM